MTRHRLLVIDIAAAMALTAILAACGEHDGEPLAPGKEISVFSRSLGDASQSAYLMFWSETAQDNFAAGSPSTGLIPFTFADMPRSIDEYKLTEEGTGTPFNTFRPYPLEDLDAKVYATGIAPSNAFDKEFPSGYDLIYINEDSKDGSIDFLASINDGKSFGSYNDPFVLEGATTERNRDRMLRFRHLTACISFVATRSMGMHDKIGVRNVKVEIVNNVDGVRNLAVPASISTYASSGKWTYRVCGESVPDKLIASTSESAVPKTESGKEVARFYVNTQGLSYGTGEEFDPFNDYDNYTPKDPSKVPHLKVNIEAELFWIQDQTQVQKKRWEGLEVSEWSVDPQQGTRTDDMFLPGYQYTVEIKFNNTAVGLQGVYSPWKEGGTFFFPVWSGSTSE